MKDQVTIFESAQFGQIRTQGTSEEPLFCLVDVRKALGLEQQTHLKERLSEKGLYRIHALTPKGMQKLLFINEPNLYRCIFQSRKKEAEQFQDWIFEEVIPAIRKTGRYDIEEAKKLIAENEQLTDRAKYLHGELTEQTKRLNAVEHKLRLDTMSLEGEVLRYKNESYAKAKALEQANMEIDALRAELRRRIRQDVQAGFMTPVLPKPTQQIAGVAPVRDEEIYELSQALRRQGVTLGQRRLARWMRDNGWLTPSRKEPYPTEEAKRLGLFTIGEHTTLDGTPIAVATLTEQGREKLFDMLTAMAPVSF